MKVLFKRVMPALALCPALMCSQFAALAADPNAPISPADYKAPVRVACVGDSITQGAGAKSGWAWPAQLSRMMGAQWDVRNFGVSGTTMLKNGDYPYWKTGAFKDALAFNPEVLVLMLGTNDSKPQNWKFKDQFTGDYRDMLQQFSALPSHPRLFCCLPPPVPNKGNYGINEAGVEDQIPMIKALAAEVGAGVIDIHTAMDGNPALFPDNVHPNTDGATLLAKTVYKALTGTEFEGDVPAPEPRAKPVAPATPPTPPTPPAAPAG